MWRIMALLAVTMLMGGCASQSTPKAALANHPGDQQKTEKVADSKAPDAVTCRNVVQTGSRFTTPYCMSNKDWKDRERATQEGARQEMIRTELNAQQTQNMPGQ